MRFFSQSRAAWSTNFFLYWFAHVMDRTFCWTWSAGFGVINCISLMLNSHLLMLSSTSWNNTSPLPSTEIVLPGIRINADNWGSSPVFGGLGERWLLSLGRTANETDFLEPIWCQDYQMGSLNCLLSPWIANILLCSALKSLCHLVKFLLAVLLM